MPKQPGRIKEKFPAHFMFQLTNEEVEIMVSQNAIPSKQHLGGSLLFWANPSEFEVSYFSWKKTKQADPRYIFESDREVTEYSMSNDC